MPEQFSVRYLVTARKDDESGVQSTWLCEEHSLDFIFLILPSVPGPDYDEDEMELDPEFEELLANLDFCGATVSGRVLDADSGEPIEGAVIQSHRNGPGPDRTMRAMSDATGFYCFEKLPPGHRFLLRMNKPGYLIGRGREAKHVRLESGQVLEGVDFHVRKGVDVCGRVVDEQGAPIEGVRIFNRCETDDEQAQSAITDGRGAFVLRGYTPDSIVSLYLKDAPYWAPPLEGIDVGGHGVGGLEIVARPAATVVGIVIDEYGLPKQQIRVCVEHRADEEICAFADTGDNGEFYFRGLPPGAYEIGVGIYKRPLLLAAGELASGVELEVATRRKLRSVARRDCFLSGRLVNRLGFPVSCARVHAFTHPPDGTPESHGETESDADGCFRVEELGEGEHQITVCADGHAVTIRKGVPANSMDVEIVLDRLITVSGHIIDDTTGAPVRDFSVARTGRVPKNLEDRRLEFTTIHDPYGRFSEWGYPGSIAVVARAHGYVTGYIWIADVEEGVELPGQEIRLKVTL